MEERERTDVQAAALERIRAQPFLGDFAVPLPRLAESDVDDLGSAFQRLGDLIGASDEKVSLRFRITDDDEERSWVLETGPKGSRVTEESEEGTDLEVLLSAETWKLIAEGTMSPLEAFGRGGMRVRGDVSRASRVFHRLAAETE